MQVMQAFSRHVGYLLLKVQALVLLLSGQYAKALSRFDLMLALFQTDRYALASRAHVLVKLNRLDESIASLQQLTRLPGPPAQQAAAWFNLGYVLRQKGLHEDACAAFEIAVGHSPGMDQAWYGLALALIQQGKLHEARRALKKTTTLQPMAPHGWYRLALVELALGAPEKALQVLDHLRQFEPKVAAQLKRDMGLAASLPQCHQFEPAHDNAR